MFLRSHGLAALTPSPRRSSASALSGSANRGDFSRAMQLEVVDSHNAPPITCGLLLRLFRFGFDFVFVLRFVCRVSHWIIWYRLPLLYCSTKNHPALLHA